MKRFYENEGQDLKYNENENNTETKNNYFSIHLKYNIISTSNVWA